MKPKFFPLLDQALDEGIRRGYRRAYKHVDEPSEESIVESIQEEVLNSLHYYFNFEESWFNFLKYWIILFICNL